MLIRFCPGWIRIGPNLYFRTWAPGGGAGSRTGMFTFAARNADAWASARAWRASSALALVASSATSASADRAIFRRGRREVMNSAIGRGRGRAGQSGTLSWARARRTIAEHAPRFEDQRTERFTERDACVRRDRPGGRFNVV